MTAKILSFNDYRQRLAAHSRMTRAFDSYVRVSRAPGFFRFESPFRLAPPRRRGPYWSGPDGAA